MTPAISDRIISWFSPRLAAERVYFRQVLNEFTYRGGLSTRLAKSWPGSQGATGVKTLSKESATALRDRARNLDRNNALASSVLDRATENVVGTGIRIEPRTGSKLFDASAKELWEDWCTRCDVRGMFSFAELQALLFRSQLRDGDIGMALVDRGGQPFLQAVEGDYIETPTGRWSDPLMEEGVEMNAVGRPVAFWVKIVDEKNNSTYTRVRADDFIFLTRQDRLNAVRGASAFAQGFELFDHISGYLDGTAIAAKAAAYFSLIIKRNNASKVFQNLGTTTNSDGDAQRTLKLEPGSVQYLQPDEDVVQISPQQPTQQFPEAIAAFARFVGLKFGLTIEQVMLDFSRTNYSSARAARLQAQQTAEIEQAALARRLASRVYNWRISRAVKYGELAGAPEQFAKHEWIPQGKPWVDPTKEIQAALLEVDLGVETRSNIALARGYDFAEIVRKNAEDRKAMQAADLPMINSTLSRHPQLGVGAQGDPLGVEKQEISGGGNQPEQGNNDEESESQADRADDRDATEPASPGR